MRRLKSARAGEAGRVSRCRSEVKSLAGQTAKATDEDIVSHPGHAGCDTGIGCSHQGDRRHHRADIEHRVVDCERGEQQSSATQEIRAAFKRRPGTQEAAANIMQVNRGATEPSASEEV